MTQRVVSVWLSHWRTDRIERNIQTGERHKPCVIYEAQSGSDKIIALNKAAQNEGLLIAQRVTDAKAILPSLKTIPRDPIGEAEELEKLANWCTRFSPMVALDPPDGLWIDATGVTHLYGGEEVYLHHLMGSFKKLQLTCRLAIADTAGTAWGFAHYGTRQVQIIPAKQQKSLGRVLPVAALRLPEKDTQQLEHLGLKRIGQLYTISPKSFRPRFGKRLIERLEQFVSPGRETLSPIQEQVEYFSVIGFVEPITNINDIQIALSQLTGRISGKLQNHGKGACCFNLMLYGRQGAYYTLKVTTSQATKDVFHIALLFKERLHTFENRFDPAIDIDRISLSATEVSSLENRQKLLTEDQTTGCDITILTDKLTARLGRDAVQTYQFKESHIPEQAYVRRYPNNKKEHITPKTQQRPILLFPRPEPIRAIAEVPDYPPRRFEWRYRHYQVAKAEGPERIADEWWHDTPTRLSRDYFRVEDITGARFWLYREGIYQRETNAPKWFMHGVFA